jgi:serine/threonine protein kinase
MVAIKILINNCAPSSTDSTQKLQADDSGEEDEKTLVKGQLSAELEKEISILQSCSCPYIVGYKGTYEFKDEIWIVMEYCGGGTVGDMVKSKGSLKESDIALMIYHCLVGLQYLHDKGLFGDYFQ